MKTASLEMLFSCGHTREYVWTNLIILKGEAGDRITAGFHTLYATKPALISSGCSVCSLLALYAASPFL